MDQQGDASDGEDQALPGLGDLKTALEETITPFDTRSAVYDWLWCYGSPAPMAADGFGEQFRAIQDLVVSIGEQGAALSDELHVLWTSKAAKALDGFLDGFNPVVIGQVPYGSEALASARRAVKKWIKFRDYAITEWGTTFGQIVELAAWELVVPPRQAGNTRYPTVAAPYAILESIGHSCLQLQTALNKVWRRFAQSSGLCDMAAQGAAASPLPHLCGAFTVMQTPFVDHHPNMRQASHKIGQLRRSVEHLYTLLGS